MEFELLGELTLGDREILEKSCSRAIQGFPLDAFLADPVQVWRFRGDHTVLLMTEVRQMPNGLELFLHHVAGDAGSIAELEDSVFRFINTLAKSVGADWVRAVVRPGLTHLMKQHGYGIIAVDVMRRTHGK